MQRRLKSIRRASRLTTLAAALAAIIAFGACDRASAQACPNGGGGGGGVPGGGGIGIPGGGGFGVPGGGLQQAFAQAQFESMMRQQAMQQMAARQTAAQMQQRQAAMLREAQRQRMQGECDRNSGDRTRSARVAGRSDAPLTDREQHIERLRQRQQEREAALQARIEARDADLAARRRRAN